MFGLKKDGLGLRALILSVLIVSIGGAKFVQAAPAEMTAETNLASDTGEMLKRSTTAPFSRSLVAAPANDDMAFATVIGALPFNDAVDTTGATVEGGEPAYTCGYNHGATVWYRFSPASSGYYVIDTSGTDFSNVVHVFNDSGLADIDCKAGGNSPILTFHGAFGETYLIGVAGSWSDSGNLAFNLHAVSAFTDCTAVDITQAECEALVDLYDTTGGTSWSEKAGWKQTAEVCAWENVDCNAGVVHGLAMTAKNLTGPLTADLSGLASLYYLDMDANSLSGDIATVINNLPTSVSWLHLSSNQFTGTVPASISSFSTLIRLRLTDNQITGDLSELIGNLPTSIAFLYLGDNQFTGTIPASITDFTNLDRFTLENNAGLVGEIPLSITGLSFTTFYYDGTFLCDPSDASYATWTGTITYFAAGTCLSMFEDDFETGDFSQWSRFNDGKGYLTACNAAAINGSWGACVDRGTDKRKQLIDETPVDKTEFHARFSFDINSLSMGTGERFRFVQVKMGAERPFFIVLKYQGGQYQIQLNTLLDDLTKVKTGWYPLSNAPHTLEIGWAAATGPGNNDGSASLYLDDGLLETLAGLDNETIFVDSFKLGFTSRLTGKVISGVFYLDDVATSSNTHIGLP